MDCDCTVLICFAMREVDRRFVFVFYNCIVPVRFLPWEIGVAFSGEIQLRQSHATQPTVHVGCFSVCIIHHAVGEKSLVALEN